MTHRLLALAALFSAISVAALAVDPAQLFVTVNGVRADRPGAVRCALWQEPAGFPMEPKQALMRAEAEGAAGAPMLCRFTVAPGTYAVAVLHDENGNQAVDTNFLGIPKEGWASSRNVFPDLRAPKFDESAITLPGGETRIEVEMHY